MAQTIGPRELALRAQREAQYQRSHRRPEMSTMTKKQTAAKALAKATGKAARAPGKKRGKKTRAKPAAAQKTPSEGPGAKTTRVQALATLLRLPGGVTSAQIEAEFGWLPHSVRALVSKVDGVQKRKDRKRGGTVYSLPPEFPDRPDAIKQREHHQQQA